MNNDREVKDEIMFSVIKNRVRITTSQKHVGLQYFISPWFRSISTWKRRGKWTRISWKWKVNNNPNICKNYLSINVNNEQKYERCIRYERAIKNNFPLLGTWQIPKDTRMTKRRDFKWTWTRFKIKMLFFLIYEIVYQDI